MGAGVGGNGSVWVRSDRSRREKMTAKKGECTGTCTQWSETGIRPRKCYSR